MTGELRDRYLLIRQVVGLPPAPSLAAARASLVELPCPTRFVTFMVATEARLILRYSRNAKVRRVRERMLADGELPGNWRGGEESE